MLKIRPDLVSILITTALLLGWGSAARSASFAGLGSLPGGAGESSAAAISADGSTVVGGEGFFEGGRAFRWDTVNGMQGIGELSGGLVFSRAYGVSSDGAVIVGASNSALGGEAFRWDSTNGMQGLGDIPGGSFNSVATGISADGSVILGNGTSDSRRQAFLWNVVDGIQPLPVNSPSGTAMNNGWGLSADGSTVVGDGFPNNREAFRWDAGGGLQRMGDLEGGSFHSRAFAVSANGSVIVGFGWSAQGSEPFRWDSTNGMQGLGLLGPPFGTTFNQARAVSADGSTVVGLSNTAASGLDAFVWDEVNGLRELDSVLTDLGADLTGWSLTSAEAISADGRTIAGNGINPDGVSEAWIAVIDETAAVRLLSPLGIAITIGLLCAVVSVQALLLKPEQNPLDAE